MITTLRILGWEAQGFRCPDHKIDCCNGGDHPLPVTLIQMPNGTGKTTTLELLRAALSGSAETWDSNEIRQLRKKDADQGEGLFELRLAHNGKRVTVRMEFDFESGLVSYKTTGNSGQADAFDPPFELSRFMNPEFVNFYVFDGELAADLLSHEHTHAEKAVESLFQIHLLNRIEEKISEYWEDKTRSVTATGERGLVRRQNKLIQWEKRLEALNQEKTEYEKELSRINDELQHRRKKHKKEIEKHQDQAKKINEAEKAFDKCQNLVNDQTHNVLNEMRGPHTLSPIFAEAIIEFKAGLDRVKLPESAAREFFEELAEESKCVCGRTIDSQIRSVIKSRAQQYLGSDHAGLLNAMKSAVIEAVGQSLDQPSKDLSNSIDELSRHVTAMYQARNKLDVLNHDAEQSDPNVLQAKEEIKNLESQHADATAALRRFEGEDDKVDFDRIDKERPDRIHAIKTVEKICVEINNQVEEAQNTLDLRRKRDVLKGIIKGAHKIANRTIVEEIRDATNRQIDTLMPYNNVRVDTIERCLILRDQSGGSVGETLSVGYAFLSTLFNRANQHELPFIVDSPAGSTDYDIRIKIGTLVPRLAGQFIAFMISSERKQFLDGLREETEDESIQYLTLFRKGIPHLENKAKENPSHIKTSDGLIVSGQEFFNEFQLDEEAV